MPEGAPLLETRRLTIAFGGVYAVNQVNFALAEGELRCLIGPNGAGKSTFFKCLTKQYQPTEGSIRFRGEEVTHCLTHEVARRGVGIKTQVPSVFDGLSVRENIWLAAAHHEDEEAVEDKAQRSLERVGITRIADRPVGQLSHGERQWVEIAMVIATDPVLILLDEPTAGMTHEEVERTAELIRDINRSAALIVVEHDMQFIGAIGKTVTVFHNGAVLVEDDVAEVMRHPQVLDIYLGRKGAA